MKDWVNDPGIIAFSLNCRIVTGQVQTPASAKWSPKPRMRVWRLDDGTLQCRKRAPKGSRGHAGFVVDSERVALYQEPIKGFIADAIAPCTEPTGKYRVYGIEHLAKPKGKK